MKSFFKKIMGKQDAPGTKERSPRVRLPLADQASFVASNGKRYPLRNVSASGLALLSAEDRFPDEASGELFLGNEKISVELMVVRRNGNEVAATFADDPAPMRAFLRKVFADEIQAQSMAEVSSGLQKQKQEEGTPRWFYTPENYELFFLEQEGRVLRFELGWGTKLMSFSSGVLREGNVQGGERSHSQAMSEIVQWQERVGDAERAKAQRLLENIPGLEVEVRRQIQEMLKS